MENQVKFRLVWPVIIGAIWCIVGIIFYFTDGNETLSIWQKQISQSNGSFYNFARGNETLSIWTALLSHIAFLTVFICSILFPYKAFALKSKIAAEKDIRKKEFENKKAWEQFQYDLNKDERQEREQHNRLETILNKLDSKTDPKDEEIKKLKDEIKKLKEQKDKEVMVNIAGKMGINLNNEEEKKSKTTKKTQK